MLGTRAASRYAKAMLEISTEKGNADAINNDMIFISQSVAQSEELKTFLSNPIINGNTKLGAVSEIFGSVSGETKELFNLLMQNKRFAILEAIASKYQEMYDEQRGLEKAVVTTAIPMDAALEERILAKIKETSTKTVVITNVVDPSILGGFILRIGDRQYNASIAHQLQVLKRELTN